MIKTKTHLLLFLFSFCTTFSVFSETISNPITITDEKETYEISPNVSVFIDEQKKMEIGDILGLEDSRFVFPEKLNFGISDSAYWLKIPVQNKSEGFKKWYLEVGHPVLDKLDLYIPKNHFYTKKSLGDKFPFYEREINHRNFVFDLWNENNQGKEEDVLVYYLRIESESTVNLPLTILSEKEFTNRNSAEQFIFGLYYGLILVMAIYNLFLFFTIRDLSYFFYVFYILTFGLLQMSLNGLAFQFVWPDSPWLASYAPTFLIPLLPVCVILFSRYFLLTFEYAPFIDKVLKTSAFFGIVLTVISLFVKISSILWVLGVYAMVNVPLVLGIAIYVLKKGYKPAIYYLTAWMTLLAGGVLFGLKSFGILPAVFVTTYGLQIGVAVEVVLLSFALASRINMIKKEKEDAQAKTLEMQKILTESYARFVPRDFLANLGKESILDVRLGDQIQKEMAVLFCDIRSFTTLSEQMTPEQNFNFINSYLSRMSPIIQRHNGFIDKFIGDAIMALFQRNALDAVAAGVEMQLYLKEYNQYRSTRNYDPIQIGIGIHSGSLMLGTIGAEERLEGTVISDTVNLASRIESLTKVYGARIAVSDITVGEIQENQFQFRFLDRVTVKGKQKPVSIYEIIDGDEPQEKDLKLETKESYEKGVHSFHQKNFEESKLHFDQVIRTNPEDKATQLYLKRLYAVLNPLAVDNRSGAELLPNDPSSFGK
ncbi:7TM diverse intracellular signaling domain-containing protein [Leptospira idonii]|uniref:Guanylate cyclase n=1 Tax=Leptospira idonii TaxID=1193500 RepID=A0A4R9M1L3_9LEPT|nr:7TM diverse intracellular signaling domain-containing protein [Leptospira idonii]TGN18628.1 guanylate cyclase [Leptospira idonii]